MFDLRCENGLHFWKLDSDSRCHCGDMSRTVVGDTTTITTRPFELEPAAARPGVEARLREFLDSREFYELMQAYRLAPMLRPDQTVAAFEAVKSELLTRVLVREANA